MINPRPKTGARPPGRGVLAAVGRLLDRVPVLGWITRGVRRRRREARFPGSQAYWEQRYAEGGTSGPGSQGQLAAFKAEVLNQLVLEHRISSVIEFGCGDGNQLGTSAYPHYIGLDVSVNAIQACNTRFADDPTKSFYLYDSRAFIDRGGLFRADLALSLDVLYHLVEDEIFAAYLEHLFAASQQLVVIYTNPTADAGPARPEPHVKLRPCLDYIQEHFPAWECIQRIPNRFPALAFAEFLVYRCRLSA